MSDFAHLHNHSDYSLLDGASNISKMVRKVKDLGMKHLAITDHGNMFGAIKFYKECYNNNINPIIGLEAYITSGSRFSKSGSEKKNKNNHLVLLAKNKTGYKNLIKLSSLSFTEGFYYKPRIDQDVLQTYCEGLICTSACLAGEIPEKILAGDIEAAEKKALYYDNLFGKGNFFLELQDHGIEEQKTVNRKLIDISGKTGIPVVATNDCHYTNREDANAQDILLCIGTAKKKNEEKRMRFKTQEFYIKSPEEMFRLFSTIPEALENTIRIAEECNLKIDFPGPLLPEYEIPEEYPSPNEYLKDLAYKGLIKRYPDLTQKIRDRTDYELNTIISMGYTGYFLVVWDFIHWAQNHNIPVGLGRGSGAGSIVAYSLKITDIDPLKYGLLFERFLNPERISMPDFDIDFCYEGRQKVIDYVTAKYGKNKVGQIITFGALKAKAVLRDVARVLDIPYAEADSIAKLVPSGPNVTLKTAIYSEPKLKELSEKGEVYKELIDTAKKLEGINRHASTHAAGIVIGKEDLNNYVPLYRDPKTGAISTQYTMEYLEDCGLVKMDLLGLKTLTLLSNTEKLIKKSGISFDLKTIPENDKKTFELLSRGESTCIFQFESAGMQGILKRARPSNIEDLIALNALYRPGPMDNIDQFIKSKWKKTDIKYPLPELETVLKETYGVIVYQEQVMEIARIVGGYSLGQADILRRAMGKKKKDTMIKERLHFIKGAEKSGHSKKDAANIFDLLIPFAGYGFNKSHAAAYALLAYKTAYLKTHYPAEYMAANLSNEINDTKKLSQYIHEAREMGIDILPPDINLSDKIFTVADGKIIYGLLAIKSIGSSTVDEIINVREKSSKYKSFIDFLEKTDSKAINHKNLEILIQSGVFDSLKTGRTTLLHNLDKILSFVNIKKENLETGQTFLFDSKEHKNFHELELEQVKEWPESELLRYEKENLGFYFSGHPMDRYRKIWESNVILDLSDLETASTNKQYTLIGMIKSLREIQTKNGKRMAFALLEDFSGSIELILFSDVWEKYRDLIKIEAVLGIKGKLDKYKQNPKFKVETVKNPEDLKTNLHSEIHIRIPRNKCKEEELFNFRTFLIDHQGNCPVFFHINNNNPAKELIVKASSQLAVSGNIEMIEKIKEYADIEDVWKD